MPKKGNKEKALAGLLSTSTVVEAAASCGLSEETLYRYLKDPEFQTEYRSARRAVVEQTIARTQSLTGEALDALRRNLTNGSNPNVEVRAAQIILDNAMKGVEITDILERLEALESANP